MTDFNNEIEKTDSDSTQNERLENIAKEIKEVKKNQQRLLEEVLSINDKIKGKRENLQKPKKSVDAPETSIESILSKKVDQSAVPMKRFLMKHTFNKVSGMASEERVFSPSEEHFGVKWQLEICRKTTQHLAVFVNCLDPLDPEDKKVEVEFDIKLLLKERFLNKLTTTTTFRKNKKESVTGWGWPRFEEWKKIEEGLACNDQLTVELEMKIKKMSGFYKKNLRSFDESTMREFSDIVLTVNGQKFYVSKLFLAAQSPYFKALFLGQFNESSQSEIELSGIDADDFQNYLEVLYGHPAIDDYTVEGILIISDMYDTQISTEKCEGFLLEKSKKSLKNRLEMAVRYNLNKLKEKCLSEVTNVRMIKSLIPEDIKDMNPSLATALLKKSLSFQ